ncbi:hypothetical protein D3C83_175960 [compost metagenome]
MALVVRVALVGRDRVRVGQQVLVDELARRLEALVQVDRADHGFERVGEDRQALPPARLHLGMAHEHEPAEPHAQRAP